MASTKPISCMSPSRSSTARSSPPDLSILFQLGAAYSAQERYDKAEPLLTQVSNERPRTDSAGYYVGFRPSPPGPQRAPYLQ